MFLAIKSKKNMGLMHSDAILGKFLSMLLLVGEKGKMKR
jgi:hypothetical protein